MELPIIEALGDKFGWQRGTGEWKAVSDAIASRSPVQVIQEVGSTIWQTTLPLGHSFQFGFAEAHTTTPAPKARIWISHIQRRFSTETDFPKVQWHPRVLWIGIGCKRGTSAKTITQAIALACRDRHLSEQAIAGLATIDLKANEAGLLEFCRNRNLPLRFYPSEILRTINVPNPNASIEQEVETPSVSEAAAILAKMEMDRDYFGESREHELILSKRKFKPPDQKGSVTMAIALATKEYGGMI